MSDRDDRGVHRPGDVGWRRDEERRELLDLSFDSKGKAEGSEAPGVVRPDARHRRHSSRWLWQGLLVLIVLGGTVGYLVYRLGAPVATAATTRFDFSRQRVGTTSGAKHLALSNTGSRTLRIASIRLAGAAAGDYSIEKNGCQHEALVSKADCSLEIRFKPHSPGSRSARLEIEGNAINFPLAVPLDGTGIAPAVSLDHHRLSFESANLGNRTAAQPVEVTNSGTDDLHIQRVEVGGEAGDDFPLASNGCSGQTLPPHHSCSLQVLFDPRAAGERRGELRIVSDAEGPASVALSGAGVWSGPALTLEPQSLDFGDQIVGRQSKLHSLTINNRSDHAVALDVPRIESHPSPFSIAHQGCGGAALAPGQGCTVMVGFRPSAEGDAEADISIRPRGSSQTLVVGAHGTGVIPRLSLSGAQLDFGAVRLGRQAKKTVQVTSTGSGAVEIGATDVSGPSASLFRIASSSCGQKDLEVGTECSVAVTFEPKKEGNEQATLTIHSSSLDSSPAVALSGKGVEPHLVIDHDAVDFGRVRRTTAATRTVRVRNTGSGALSIASAKLGGEGASDYSLSGSCRGRLAAGASCRVVVRFTPQREGQRSAVVSIFHDAAAKPAQIALSGIGLPPPIPGISVSPRQVEFGPVTVGDRSSFVTLTVHNPGSGKLLMRKVALAGPDASEFHAVSGTCDGLPYLAPDGDCTIGVRFIPAKAGPRRARLEIHNNSPKPLVAIPLRGKGEQ